MVPPSNDIVHSKSLTTGIYHPTTSNGGDRSRSLGNDDLWGTADAGGGGSGGYDGADDGEGDAGASTIPDGVVVCERGMVM
ncbi:hypothetical protein Tco_0783310 [Tanacetum coccineum]